MLVVCVEDSPKDRKVAQIAFHDHHLVLFDGPGAWTFLEEFEPDILLLDLNLPTTNGYKLALHGRELYPNCTIIVVSSFSDPKYIIEALRHGAEYYIPKEGLTPEHLRVETMEAHARRQRFYPCHSAMPILTYQDLIVDRSNQKAVWQGISAKLTEAEMNLLLTLVANPEQVFSVEQLANAIGYTRNDHESARKNIKTHLHNLREKFKREGTTLPLVSIRAKGYRWQAQA